jgi:hypothetical protein
MNSALFRESDNSESQLRQLSLRSRQAAHGKNQCDHQNPEGSANIPQSMQHN